MIEKDLISTNINNLPSVIEQLIDKSNTFFKISTRAADPSSKELAQFNVFDEAKLARIADDMPEINRATKVFGRKNTQTTNKLMTLTMLADASPYRVLYQCLAQIETKRGAVKENTFKLQKDKVKMKRLIYEIQQIKDKLLDTNVDCAEDKTMLGFVLEEKQIELQELATSVSDSMLYLEGALKEIASFQSAYKQICKNKGLPEKWDEVDFEKAEIKHHVRMAFLHAYRDIMAHGRLGMGTLEYLQQFGINPNTAFKLVSQHIQAEQGVIKQNNDGDVEMPAYEMLEEWLDSMENMFADAYLQVIKRIGLDSLHEEWYMYKDSNNVLLQNRFIGE